MPRRVPPRGPPAPAALAPPDVLAERLALLQAELPAGHWHEAADGAADLYAQAKAADRATGGAGLTMSQANFVETSLRAHDDLVDIAPEAAARLLQDAAAVVGELTTRLPILPSPWLRFLAGHAIGGLAWRSGGYGVLLDAQVAGLVREVTAQTLRLHNTQLREANDGLLRRVEEIRRLAGTDSLTGLLNRRALDTSWAELRSGAPGRRTALPRQARRAQPGDRRVCG